MPDRTDTDGDRSPHPEGQEPADVVSGPDGRWVPDDHGYRPDGREFTDGSGSGSHGVESPDGSGSHGEEFPAGSTADRRGFLAAIGAAATSALAGCVSIPGRSTPTQSTTTTETTTRERPTTTTTTDRTTTTPTTGTTTSTVETPEPTTRTTATPDTTTPRSYDGLRTTVASGVSIVDVELQDGSIQLSQDSVPPGRILFFLLNRSLGVHEFVIIRTERSPSALPTLRDGSVDLDRLDVLNAVRVPPGERRYFAQPLRAANYVLVCNVGRHYSLGEYAAFKVV